MEYTVKQLAKLAGVSVRTLHYYDQIGLLAPSRVHSNGYRSYDAHALLRLQQILFFRELDFSLNAIGDLLDRPGFDTVAALQLQREALQQRMRRLYSLIETIDKTMLHIQGEQTMHDSELFAGFDAARQAEHEAEIQATYGDHYLKQAQRNWASYSAEEKQRVLQESGVVYTDLARLLESDSDPTSPEVMAVMVRWHQSVRLFYEPTREVLLGLGERYATHPDFIATFQRMHPELPEFLRRATAAYAAQAQIAE